MASSGSFSTSVAQYTGHAGYPDYALFEWTSIKDIANHQTIVNYTLTAKLSSGSSTTNYTYVRTRKLTVTIDGVSTVLQNTDTKKKVVKDTVIFSGSFNVPAHSDGTSSFSAAVRLALYSSSVNSTGSDTFILDSLDSPDTLIVPENYTINNITQNTYSVQTNTEKERYYDLSYTLNGTTVTLWTNHHTDHPDVPTIMNLDLLTAMNNVASAVITFTLTTYNDQSVLIGTSTAVGNITINLSNIKPSLSNGSITIATSPINSVLIAGFSTATITAKITLASGNNSAKMVLKSISTGSTTTSESTARTTSGNATLTTNTLPANATDNTSASVIVYAVDSRGAVSSDLTISFPTIYGYEKPKISGAFYRVTDNTTTPPVPDEAGQYVYCDFSATISSVNSLNSLTLSCTYTGESSGTATNHSWIALTEEGSLAFTVTATDLISSSVNTFTVLMAVFPLDLTQEYTSQGTEVGATIGGIAELNKFKVELDSYFDKKVYGTGIIEYIRGEQTSTTASWIGTTEQERLYDGMTIMYYLPKASASSTNVTLNLTLPSGSTTGAKNVYYNSTTRMTTHFGAYSQILLTYHENYNINGTNYTGWWHDTDKNDNTVACAYCSTGASTVAKTATCSGYALRANNMFIITFSNSNTATSFTLNINSKGAKEVYINGAANGSGNTTLPAGTYFCYYDGTRYYLRTDGRLPIPSEVESGIITRSSGAALDYAHGYRSNNVITVYGKVSYSTSVSSGSNIFEGTISALYYPPHDVETFAYYQGHAIGIRIQPDGTVIVRNASSSSVTINDGIQFSTTYVVYDSTVNANAIVPSVSQRSSGVVTVT